MGQYMYSFPAGIISGREGAAKGIDYLTSHVLLQLIVRYLLVAVRTHGHGDVLSLGLRARYIVVSDPHGLGWSPLGCSLGGLRSLAGFGAFGYSVVFFFRGR